MRQRVAEQMRLPLASQSDAFRALATPLAALYGALVRARAAAYDRGLLRARTLPGRVVSIGNIAAGGTGKSPVVAWLAAELLALGHAPAILTRGYGSSLAPDDSLAMLGGAVVMPPRRAASGLRLPDEGRMQSVALPAVPVVAGARRFEAAMRFLAEHGARAPTHWLLDDGFQHRRLKRDVDIVLLDAREPWGNGALLPRGILREPETALARADAVIFTRAASDAPWPEDVARVRAFGPRVVASARFAAGAPEPVAPATDSFDPSVHAPVLVASGIAAPDALRVALGDLGIRTEGAVTAPDHGALDRAAILRGLARAGSVVTTAKDYWRDPDVFVDLPKPAFVLPLAVQVAPDARAALLALLALAAP